MCIYVRKRLWVKTENKVRKCDKRKEEQKHNNKMKRNGTFDKKNEEDKEEYEWECNDKTIKNKGRERKIIGRSRK
jgi:hypothetical protein